MACFGKPGRIFGLKFVAVGRNPCAVTATCSDAVISGRPGATRPFENLVRSGSTALELAQAVEVTGLIQEAKAGLAEANLADENLAEAVKLVNQILEYLEAGGQCQYGEESLVALERIESAAWVLLVCCEVLQANGDPCFEPTLDFTIRQVNTTADRIENEDRKKAYLNIATHRRILEFNKGRFNIK